MIHVNQHIDMSYFKFTLSMDYVRSFIYTFSDIHLRLIMYSISWVLLNEKHVFIYFIQTLVPWVLVLILEQCKLHHSILGLLQIISANICPQILIPWAPSNASQKSGVVYIPFKSVSNILYGILLWYYSLWLTSTKDHWNIFDIDMSRLTQKENSTEYHLISICQSNKTETSMFIPKKVILNILMPIAVVLLIISSAEILIFFFCRTSWNKFIFGHKKIGYNDKINMKVQFVLQYYHILSSFSF